MQVKKVVLAASAVAFMAAGCGKSDGTAQNNSIQPTPLTADAASQVLTGNGAPIGWVPFEAEGYTFIMPLSWYAQGAPDNQNQLIISNSTDTTATKPGVTVLRVGAESKATDKTLSSVVSGLIAGKQGASKVVEGVTTSGLQMASGSFSDGKGTVWVYAVQKSSAEYILIRAMGNTQDPFIQQIVNSVALRSA